MQPNELVEHKHVNPWHAIGVWFVVLLLLSLAFYGMLQIAIRAKEKRVPSPKFNGQSWSCPAPYAVYADESDALAGRPFTYCVRP